MNPMLLDPTDVELFFKLHRALMFFVNQRLKVIPDDLATPDEFSAAVAGNSASRSVTPSSITPT